MKKVLSFLFLISIQNFALTTLYIVKDPKLTCFVNVQFYNKDKVKKENKLIIEFSNCDNTSIIEDIEYKGLNKAKIYFRDSQGSIIGCKEFNNTIIALHAYNNYEKKWHLCTFEASELIEDKYLVIFPEMGYANYKVLNRQEFEVFDKCRFFEIYRESFKYVLKKQTYCPFEILYQPVKG